MEGLGYGHLKRAPTVLVATPYPCLSPELAQTLAGLCVNAVHQSLADGEIPARLEGAPDLLLLVLGEGHRLEPDSLIGLIEDAAGLHCPVILSAPLSFIDRLSHRFWSRCHALLADPDLIDLAASIAGALARRPMYFSDVSRDVDADRLQRLADEVGRIARTLAILSASAPLSDGGVNDLRPGFGDEPEMTDNANLAREIRAMLRLRRLRDRFFDSSLFADPAWDMLLDLMAARLERVQVAVSSLCIAACVPPTTALRWIKLMTESGLFERVSDPIDGRRVYIRLSDSAFASMTRLLAAVRASETHFL